MSRLYPALMEAAAASLFLIPFLLRRGTHKENRTFTILQILFTVYLSAVYAVAGLPCIFYIRFRPHLNTIPFLYMFSDHTTSLLNVLLFLPFGIFLPVLWTTFRSLFRTVLCGLLLSAAIEFLQIFTYRATDVNDLITNTLGTLLGYFIGMIIVKTFPKPASCSTISTFSSLLLAVFCVMFFIQPLFLRILFSIT